MLRYCKFEPSFKLQWCCALDLFGSQIRLNCESVIQINLKQDTITKDQI